MLNQANIAVPDGIGIFWAHKFLSIPLTAKNYWLKILQALWQIKYSLAAILFYPKYIYSSLSHGREKVRNSDFQNNEGLPKLGEKIVGADLIWDIAKKAAAQNLSIYLLGGFADTPKLVARKLATDINLGRRVYLSLNIAGYSNKNPNDISIIDDINKTNPDILLVAYGPIKQEKWIYEHRDKLPTVKLFMGLGGTFDYIAGKRLAPPSPIRKIGLEWLWRLFTQPHRIKRIWQATFGLIMMLMRYKVFESLPLRSNVAAVVINSGSQILICQRDPKNHHVDIIHTVESLSSQNYWQFPQGGIDGNEDLVEAAKREALEETGLKNLELIKVSPHTNTYIWNNALRHFWKNRRHQNRGQTQNIVYFKHNGDDDDVKIDNDEFINYRWINIQDLEKFVHPERLSLIKIVQNDLLGMQQKGII